MTKKIIFALFIFIFSKESWSQKIPQFLRSDDVIQVPEDCIQKLEAPCLVKARVGGDFHWGEQKIFLYSGSVLQIEKEILKSEDQKNMAVYNFDLLKGLVRLNSKQKYKIFGYEIKNQDIQYILRTAKNVQVLDSASLDLKTFSMEVDKLESTKGFVFQKSELPLRPALVQFLSQFYLSKTELKQTLNLVSKKYQQRLNLESKKQADFLQNHENRHLASVENEKKQRVAQQQQILEDRKKLHEIFFMRTFER